MKRKLIAIMAACSMALTVPVMAADPIDFSSYSDDELKECYDNILKEIVNRNFSKSADISIGTYTIGQDIPAGQYVFTPADTERLSRGDLSITRGDDTILSEHITSWDEATYFLSLENGDILETSITGTLTISTTIIFE